MTPKAGNRAYPCACTGRPMTPAAFRPLRAPRPRRLARACRPRPAQPVHAMSRRRRSAQVVRDYLLKNPEVLQEAMVELERRQQETQTAAQAGALKDIAQAAPRTRRTTSSSATRRRRHPGRVLRLQLRLLQTRAGRRRDLIKDDPKLRVVLKDFPVLGRIRSRRAASRSRSRTSSRATSSSTSTSELHGDAAAGSTASALAVAKEIGVDMARLQKDMESAEVKRGAPGERRPRRQARPHGTPAFIIGDEVISARSASSRCAASPPCASAARRPARARRLSPASPCHRLSSMAFR